MAEPKTGKAALRRYAGGKAEDNYDAERGAPADTVGANATYNDPAEMANPTQATVPEETPFQIGGAT